MTLKKNGRLVRQVSLLLLLFAVFTLLFQSTSIPVVEAQAGNTLPVYKLMTPQVNASYVQTLGSNLFGLKGQVQHAGGVFFLNDSNSVLQVFEASGGVWFGNLTQLNNESAMPTLPSNDAALSIANTFLSQHGLMPTQASFGNYGASNMCSVQKDMTPSCRQLDVQIMYNFTVAGLPADGPGAKIKVTVGDMGRIIGLDYFWRSLQPSIGDFMINPQAPIMQQCQMNVRASGVQAHLTMAYYADNVLTPQSYLQPNYMCSGSASSTDSTGDHPFLFRTLNFPATNFSPQVKILSPLDGSIIQAGMQVTFDLNVTGGTGPYQYQWTSEKDGIIGTTKSFSFAPTPAIRNGTVGPYYIIAKVTDANGQTGTYLAQIKVVPTSTATYPASGIILIALTLYATSLLLRKRRPSTKVATVFLLALMLTAFVSNVAAYQFGTEWIGAEVGCDTDSINWKNAIGSLPFWSSRFYWPEPDSWESDFKYEGAPGTGDAHNWVDTVDFQWYCGHANGDGFAMRSNHDDTFVEYYDAGSGEWTTDAHGWGTTLKWIIIAACGPLEYTTGNGDVFARWGPAFKGLHYILAYASTSQGSYIEGSTFIFYATLSFLNINLSFSIRDSWIITASIAQPSSVLLAYMRAGSSIAPTYYEHLPGYGFVSADPFPKGYLAYLATNA